MTQSPSSPCGQSRSRGRTARNMAVPGSLWRQPANRGLVSHCTHHHVIVFLLTFFSCSLFHASRETFSNVKVSISNEWTLSCLNSTAHELQPYELWNSIHLLPSAEAAALSLGTLDTILLFSYPVGLSVSSMLFLMGFY